MEWWLFLIPVSCAFSCWLLMRLFFSILFRPYEPKPVLGIRLQGILPAKQPVIAQKTAAIVAKKFLSLLDLEKRVNDPALLQKIMPMIEEHIDDFLRNKLKKEMPVISMFIGDKTITSLKQVFIKELETLFPQVIGSFASNLVNDLDIEGLVRQKLASISMKEAETLFRQNLRKELRLAAVLSIGLGLLTGLITMLIIILVK
jgi:uncharacterized membrane protein YheB (UPF0754 family)